MSTITTQAWVLYQGTKNGNGHKPNIATLRREDFSFPDITENEVLAEPVYGCWEANMDHAMKRQPVDICWQRREERVVLGNAGVVRILKTGRSVTTVKPGDHCFVFCNAIWDGMGFTKKVFGYDAPNTVGVLAKQMKLHERVVSPIPENSKYTLQQWAAFSLRHVTAWANWKAAYGCFRAMVSQEEYPDPHVWGWGGGVTLAELELALHFGCQAAMMSSDETRLEIIKRKGIRPINRQQFPDLKFDDEKYQTDAAYKKSYQESEERFLQIVKENTHGRGASIFIDYVGLPVVRATLKALACPGVLTTAGWKAGMKISSLRAIECMNWHAHVHTHYARYVDGLEAARFAEANGWMPTIDLEPYSWNDIPQLAEDYAQAKLTTYFPLFQVNPL
jgi:NADPH:quinone reductase-like Zn-dependent oxidoreductase